MGGRLWCCYAAAMRLLVTKLNQVHSWLVTVVTWICENCSRICQSCYMYHCPLPNKTKLKLVDWLKELNQVQRPNAVGSLCLWQCFEGVLSASLPLLFEISFCWIICVRVWSSGDFGAKRRSKENRWGEYFSYSSNLLTMKIILMVLIILGTCKPTTMQ